MDAFYASVEQRDEPALRGKPVAVGYPAKRGVVAAATTRREVSEFARRCRRPSRFGSAPNSCSSRQGSTFTAKCPKQIHAIFKDYTRLVEPLSLDEAYLDVTDNLRASRLRGRPPGKSGRAFTRKPGSPPRPEFPATNSSPSSHRTIANQTASSRSYPARQKPLLRPYRRRSSTA